MLSVLIGLSPAGSLEHFRASGHAGAEPAGSNLACAAASVLLRTTARVIQGKQEIQSAGTAPGAGEMEFDVTHVPSGALEWMRGVTDCLLEGCLALERETPGAVEVRIVRRG
jgi:uncharacterized protein YsxB (DUF464 family)